MRRALENRDGTHCQPSLAAFSVVELLVALAIAAIITGSAVLAWPRIEAAFRLEAGLQQLAADLQGARTLAIASASRVRLVFRAGTSTYERERSDEDGLFRHESGHALPRGLVVAAVNSGGDVTFSARGNAENATIVLRDRRGARRSVVVNQRGRITILGVQA